MCKRYTPLVESYPVSDMQKNSANLLGRVAIHRQVVELTYYDVADESVILIHPDVWHKCRKKFPVDEGKIRPPVGVKDARMNFAELREAAVFNGWHTMITRRDREHAVVVPLPWACQALPEVQKSSESR